MANLKYKNGNDWNSLSVIRGPKGDNADITINGQTKENAVIYAAEKPGIAGQALISHGDGQAPDWATIAPVATTGNYNDLNGLPTIPSTTNDLISGSSAALTSGGAYTAFAQQGVPAGGTAGQVLIKDSSNNYDTSWGTLSTGIVQESTFENVTAKANTLLTSLTLSPGVWIISGHMQYQGMDRRWYLSITNAGIQMGAYDNSGWVDGMVTGIVTPTSSTTYELHAWFMTAEDEPIETICHNGYLKAVKIK